MRRYDLRGYKNDFKKRALEILDESAEKEVLIFIFENTANEQLKDFINAMRDKNADVLNSLKFNEVDWTITVRMKGLNE
ncbi:MAG: NADH-ubiquinone oxidoreductase subunit E family protein [Campylobacteraceae bacterium]|jgi:NADH-quinone oxidoreductase subunit E|nr:NADH-ubiquinone oxidoreductase subunit E family protein [Campylobacteraceae bacterium]